MKKNKIMRIASVLLVLTLLSTCAIGGTFAKYTTSGNATDTARVAKWGVTITGEATNNALFQKQYTDDTNGLTVSADVDVVAPGTEGTFTAFDVEGVPEVKTTVSYTATVALSDNWKDAAGAYYCPVVVSVNGTPVTGATSAADYADKIEAAIAAVTKTYDAGTDLKNVDANLAITWAWAFDGDDVKDTHLGNLETAPTISIAVTATIEQVD